MGGRGAAARGFVPGGAAEGALRRRGARRGGGGGERGAGAALGWEEGDGEKKKKGKEGLSPAVRRRAGTAAAPLSLPGPACWQRGGAGLGQV